MAENVQQKIDYRFVNEKYLHDALKAAHRNDKDDVSYDGNRRLAIYGARTIDWVETEYAVFTEQKTEKEVNSLERWFKSKQGRADACRKLGIDSCIERSSRQEHEPPSVTVLANALSAIIGAVWVDLEKQNESAANARSKVLEILRRISLIVEQGEQNASSDPGERVALDPDEGFDHIQTASEDVSNVIAPDVTADYGSNLVDSFTVQLFGEGQDGTLDVGLTHQAPPLYDTMPTPDLDSFDIAQDYMPSLGDLNTFPVAEEDSINSFEVPHIGWTSDNLEGQLWSKNQKPLDNVQLHSNQYVQLQSVTPVKRKYTFDKGPNDCAIAAYSNFLHNEYEKLRTHSDLNRKSLANYLSHPDVQKISNNSTTSMQLRFLYLSIGSGPTVLDFRECLRAGREKPTGLAQDSGSELSLSERFNEICRLESEEALCVLVRRCHALRLCVTEADDFNQNNWKVMDMSNTFRMAQKTQRGNPLVMRQAAITDYLADRIRPGLDQNSHEFKKLRQKIKRLRRLAENLRMLTEAFGFGILALLPSGPSFPTLSLTDTTLCSIAASNFRDFTKLLHDQQGSVLTRLSQEVEPALEALISGTLTLQTLFPIECTDSGALERRAKGLLGSITAVPRLVEHPI